MAAPWVEFPSLAVVAVAGKPAASAGLDRLVVADTLAVVLDRATSPAVVDKTEALPVELTVASRGLVAVGTKAVKKMAWLPQVIEMGRSGLAAYTAVD